ncbi:citrate lyase acyl carrier protein [Mycoplasmatota bacterium]|nr:citrate lyase acyl carrier protein [Mycoplasmatota bacterium]
MKIAQAGTIESNDALVIVSPSDKLIVEIDSIVFDKFGDAINQVIVDTLKEHQITCKVVVKDKGAYDYTIKARLITALRRAQNE